MQASDTRQGRASQKRRRGELVNFEEQRSQRNSPTQRSCQPSQQPQGRLGRYAWPWEEAYGVQRKQVEWPQETGRLTEGKALSSIKEDVPLQKKKQRRMQPYGNRALKTTWAPAKPCQAASRRLMDVPAPHFQSPSSFCTRDFGL